VSVLKVAKDCYPETIWEGRECVYGCRLPIPKIHCEINDSPSCK